MSTTATTEQPMTINIAEPPPSMLGIALDRHRRRWAGARGEVPEVIPYGPSVLVGGPAYHSAVDVRHAECVAQLSSVAVEHGVGGRLYYTHGSALSRSRCEFLAHALRTRADVAITVDADCHVGDDGGVRGGEILLALAQRCVDLDGPVGVLFPVGSSGQLNANKVSPPGTWWGGAPFRTDDVPSPFRFTRCSRVGTGIMIFPLAWYRRVYAAQIAPAWAFVFRPDEDPRPLREQWADEAAPRQVGEDYSHCDTIDVAGGRVHCVHVPTAGHAAHRGHIERAAPVAVTA